MRARSLTAVVDSSRIFIGFGALTAGALDHAYGIPSRVVTRHLPPAGMQKAVRYIPPRSAPGPCPSTSCGCRTAWRNGAHQAQGTICSMMNTRARPAAARRMFFKNCDAFLVVPVVQDLLQAVGVGLRNLLEHIAADIVATRLQSKLPGPQRIAIGHHSRQIQHYARKPRICAQQGAVR